MVDSTSENQGLVSVDFSDETVKIDERSGLGKSPIEQVWEAVLHSIDELGKSPMEQVWEAVLTGNCIDAIDEREPSAGSREFDMGNAYSIEQDKTKNMLRETMESGAETAQEKIQEAPNPEGSDVVDNSEILNVEDQSSDADIAKKTQTLKELSEMLENPKAALCGEMQEKIQEATKGE
jgi:uncharacterized protein (UPF0297 family)